MKMKPAMPVIITTTTTILVCALAGGLALAQNPSIIQNTRSTMNGVNSRATAASNEALGAPPASGTAVVPGQSVSAQAAPSPRTRVAKRGPGAVRRVVPGRVVEPKVESSIPSPIPKNMKRRLPQQLPRKAARTKRSRSRSFRTPSRTRTGDGILSSVRS